MTSEEIIKALIGRDKNVADKAIIWLYKTVAPKIEGYVLRNSGTRHDAEDLFQDALVELIKTLSKPDTAIKSSVDAYLFGIARNLWLKKLRREKRLPQSDIGDLSIKEEEIDDFPESKIAIVSRVMESLSERCKEILTLFYFHKLSMQAIAERLGYGSDTVVKSKKYKCLTELRKRVVEDPEYKELIK